MISWLPTYLLTAKGFSLSSMALGAALPYTCALLASNGFGAWIDRLSIGHDRTLRTQALPHPVCALGRGIVAGPASFHSPRARSPCSVWPWRC